MANFSSLFELWTQHHKPTAAVPFKATSFFFFSCIIRFTTCEAYCAWSTISYQALWAVQPSNALSVLCAKSTLFCTLQSRVSLVCTYNGVNAWCPWSCHSISCLIKRHTGIAFLYTSDTFLSVYCFFWRLQVLLIKFSVFSFCSCVASSFSS